MQNANTFDYYYFKLDLCTQCHKICFFSKESKPFINSYPSITMDSMSYYLTVA